MADLTPSIDELAKAAMAESLGPWKRDDVTYPIADTGDFDTILRIVDANGKEVFSLPWDGLSEKEPVLDFIAAANPEAWLSLSSRVERARREAIEDVITIMLNATFTKTHAETLEAIRNLIP